jgi:hypothetical protein
MEETGWSNVRVKNGEERYETTRSEINEKFGIRIAGEKIKSDLGGKKFKAFETVLIEDIRGSW